MFKVSKIKNNGGLVPFSPIRINLWIYLRKTSRSKGNKKRKSENKVERSLDSKKKKPAHKKKSDKKKKRKKNGRRIKLFVTNGSEKLTTTRMNIDLKGWYKIELPVSRLWSEISKNDNFKLCFKCKRCRRYKMVLYRKDSKDINVKAPRIPFIEFTRPAVRSRSRRSTDVTINKRRHHHSSRGHAHFVRAVNDSCCEEVIYKQDITTWFPNILYPSTINFSTCGATFNSSSYKPLLSQTNTDLREITSVDNAKCIPRSYENFSFLFIDKQNDLKTGDIPNLIPTGCVCQQSLSLNHWRLRQCFFLNCGQRVCFNQSSRLLSIFDFRLLHLLVIFPIVHHKLFISV